MLDPNHSPYEQQRARPADASQDPALVVGFFAAIVVALLVASFPAVVGYLGAAAVGAVAHRVVV
ncbi:hypothetical protein AArcSl_1246 [Halalkaliarchaeum desulfuricum]|uniref:Uncharacterized protein n=1 Tax=Halalkaliarchaeum desulfuricum TaxID=2055893 RepID=A0A343TIF6_9EURY|nr:hypothetical protein [Halalkaliarchaeum desulfuricum]AUX08878.1 hypothetical protein AArcSl_1246 [Halalkaliarchaeum desulfuricum]